MGEAINSLNQTTFTSSTLSFLLLMLISLGVYIFSKRFTLPYTVMLVIVGLLLVPISGTDTFGFIDDFKLTPDILFYVFLPVLLFESAYHMNYKELLKNSKIIASLAIFGLMISASIISISMYFLFGLIGIDIPFLVCLLFGAIISATDPVAVLSIFKNVGTPRRLSLIFEGESVFNDGTALALFTVILGIILEGTVGGSQIFSGFLMFVQMIIFGILFGGVFGFVFSKIIGYIKNEESAEIGLTLIVAHITFLSAEMLTEYFNHIGISIHISAVIATAIAGITIGNYGLYKISPKVEESMEKFWEFFAFVSNSIVFILLGLLLADIQVDFAKFLLPISLTIFIVIIARAISVFVPLTILNQFLSNNQKVPTSWQHLLSWGSLRGALAIMMVLLIPGPGFPGYEAMIAFQSQVGWDYEISIKEFLLVITIGCILFTLFIKAPTIGIIMRKMGVNKLHDLEKFEFQEGKILMNLKVLEKLKSIEKKGYIQPNESLELFTKYRNNLHDAVKSIKKLVNAKDTSKSLIKNALSLHALGIEKQYLKELYNYNEIDEYNFKKILRKLKRQIERIEGGNNQLSDVCELKVGPDFFERLMEYMRPRKDTYIDEYMRSRARIVITRKVIKEMEHLRNIDFGFDKKYFDNVIELYKGFYKKAITKKENIRKNHPTNILLLESKLADKSLLKIEEKVAHDMFEKGIITPKLYLKFKEEIEKEIYADYRKII